MPAELYTNNASTTVSSGGTTAPGAGTQETWTVASSSGFPVAATGSFQFHVWDIDPTLSSYELILVTNVSGTTWTVIRGAEGSTPVAHTAGFTIVNVLAASQLGMFPQGLGPLYALGLNRAMA